MRVRHLLSAATLCCAVSATSFAQAVPDVKLPPSPPGQAAVQLGGSWEKTEGGQRYRDGKCFYRVAGRERRTACFG